MTRTVGIFVFLAALLAAMMSHQAASDDAYITLRIARNALEGHGFHYNVDETGVQAATSPLNLLLSYGVGKVGSVLGYSIEGSLFRAPGVITLIALPAMALGIFVLLARRSRNPMGAMIAALLATLSPVVIATIGLETQMLLALLVWSLVALESPKFALAGVLIGLAILARHDSIIMLGLLTAMLFLSKQRREAIQVLGAAVLMIAPWFAYAAIALGQTVPTTLASKMAQGGTAYWPGQYYAQFWKWVVNCSFGMQWIAALLCGLAMVGLVLAVRAKNRLLVALATYLALHFAAYSFFNVPDYHWYFAPYFVGLAVLAGFAVGCLPDEFRTRAVAVVPLGALLIGGLKTLPTEEPRLASYREIGKHLEGEPPKKAAGMMEIGIIGFYAPHVKVFDFSGIVTPEQIPRVAQNAAIAWIDNPSVADKVVTRMVRHPLEPDLSPDFESLYVREFATNPNPLFANGVQVWRLK